ncbi:undecaprenyl-diphosphatase [Bacillus altitudinis]|uniref:undecaprenyl-diphosphatase n=1 Tax=Bacillus altitudinis TaxID=293387 RepID=UPI0035DAFDC4
MNYELFKVIHGMAHHSEFLDQAMIFITKKAILVYALVLLICWFLGNHKFKKHVFFSGVTGIVALIVNFAITLFYYEERPFVAHKVDTLIPHSADASFPSDHTTGALALSLAIRSRNKKLGNMLLVFGLLTGFSRIWVGHHYPFDVLGSLIVSIVVVFIMNKLWKFFDSPIDRIVTFYENIVGKIFRRKQKDQGSDLFNS